MNRQPENTALDYLVIGHITRDQIGDGYQLGGTAVYSSLLAHRMGLKVALFTSCAPDLPLDSLKGIKIHNQPGSKTTTFKNMYSSSGRTQYLLERANDLDLTGIPESWKQAKIIHLGPVAGEIQVDAGSAFPESTLAYSLQGWLRNWDEDNLIHSSPLPDFDPQRSNLVTAFLSIEDLGYQLSLLEPIKDKFPNLVLTNGNQGAELHKDNKKQTIPPVKVQEIDPTGAGDIFAAAFMINWVIKGMPPVQSARLANKLAAISVTRTGIEGIPTELEIAENYKVYK